MSDESLMEQTPCGASPSGRAGLADCPGGRMAEWWVAGTSCCSQCLVAVIRAAVARLNDSKVNVWTIDGRRHEDAYLAMLLNRGRCESWSPDGQGGRCGLEAGHDGNHTLLIPTSARWAPHRLRESERP